jgi:hypothetical protein
MLLLLQILISQLPVKLTRIAYWVFCFVLFCFVKISPSVSLSLDRVKNTNRNSLFKRVFGWRQGSSGRSLAYEVQASELKTQILLKRRDFF